MDEFRPFDTRGFLKASKHWDDDIRRLQEELNNMSELPAVSNNNGIRSGNIADITQRMAMRRVEIREEIDAILWYKDMLEYALSILSTEERELIDGFYFRNKAKGVFAWEYGRRYGMSERKVYQVRKAVERKMGAALDKMYMA